MEADGATVFEAGPNLAFYRFGERWPLVSTGVRLLCVSQPLLELTMRQRLGAHANVEVSGEPVEGDRWLVTLGGWHGHATGADPAGFAEFARSLPHPPVADLLAEAEPLTSIKVHRFPRVGGGHFEWLKRAPAGFAVAGDAFAAMVVKVLRASHSS